MAKIAKLFQFSFKELLNLAEAWLVFLKWDLIISNARYGKWRDKMPEISNNHNHNHNQNQNYNQNDATALKKKRVKVSAIINITEIAGRHHFRTMNCLRRCLTQKQILDKRGYHCNFHIGVKIEQGSVKAHSWLTFQGYIINDSDDVTTRYSELQQANKEDILYSLK